MSDEEADLWREEMAEQPSPCAPPDPPATMRRVGKTTGTKLASIPLPLLSAWKEADKAGLVREFSTVTVEAMEQELRRVGLEPPPRPEPSAQTAAASAARWKRKPKP